MAQGGKRPGAGRKEGSKNLRTLQWEALGDAITSTHTERFNRILSEVKDETFVTLYLQALEYFKPKQARTEVTGKDGAPLPAPTIILSRPK